MEKSIEEIIKDLEDEDEFTQEEACALLESNAKESLEPLIEALLTNRNKNVKISAAKILGLIGDERAIEPLITTLRDNNKLVRREASTSLSQMGEKAIDPLINILTDDDWKVRGAAAWALGGIGNERAIDPLNKLLDDESGFVNAGAKWAIANIKS
ncbi:putative phycocyanin operon protein Z [Methanobrevibacter cuticularis]|uniref:Putative phycocyanin operon protein Z n=1 Tax=Methanobrevibacter cuticularis TaxID=47311 RepID=A0A166EYB6_9EURY|nr:HEAT repeat domain-containing protein [Methanobrevibacter cuticularis]KZX17136.1 putative phycocyanin operon protein Z [Methanobrevibacter cuticularis]